jgi:hypothetical protein
LARRKRASFKFDTQTRSIFVVKSRFAFALALTLVVASLTSFASGSAVGVTVISKQCGDAQMSLNCPATGHGTANCLHPALYFKSKNGQQNRLSNPKGLEKQQPIGLACTVSKNDKSNYFYVLYGSLPTGCGVCEWHHLYAANGKLLTSSFPATVDVPNAPPAQSVAPNNQSFDDLSKKLNLDEYKADSIVCTGPHVDAKGNLLCPVNVEVGRGR